MAASSSAPYRARVRALLRAVVVLVVVLGLDQLTKHTIAESTTAREGRNVFFFVKLVRVRNRGVAFGFFSGGGVPVLVFTVVALALLLAYFLRHPERHGLWLPTGLLVGGALGNVVDRLASGAVTDFIKLPLWPAFNIADTAITLGVLSLIWVLDTRERTEPVTQRPEAGH